MPFPFVTQLGHGQYDGVIAYLSRQNVTGAPARLGNYAAFGIAPFLLARQHLLEILHADYDKETNLMLTICIIH